MRICLISPPTVTDFEDMSVAETEAIRLIAEHAPIGVLSLAAVLDAEGDTPGVIDLNRWYYQYLRSAAPADQSTDFCSYTAARLELLPYDIFGFSTICSSYPLTLRIAQRVKRARPDATVILGGPQASVVDVATMRAFPWIDYIVRGEAEETLPMLVDSVRSRGRLGSIPGITFRHGTEIVRTPNAPVIKDLDSLPRPAFHLYEHLKECRYVPLELGRGCPFACEFCSTNDFFRRRFRLKSPERVISEMRWIAKDYGITTFDLIHDMFTVNRRKVVEFCEAVLGCGAEFYWNCSARTDCVDDELISLMAEAGCRGIFFGIESGSARMQKLIKKRLDLDEAMLRIQTADKHGITTAVSLITGFPEETPEDVRDTVAFLMDSLRFDHAQPQLHLLAPLAETPIESRYHHELTLDDIYSDMSYQGWQQGEADRRLIAAHRDVFPNFYSVPTPSLDRPYLKELREFILNGIARFRWLLVLLHQASGNLLTVFDAWREWRARTEGDLPGTASLCAYYANLRFHDDFLHFLRASYLPGAGDAYHAVAAMVELETSFDVTGEGPPAPGEHGPGNVLRHDRAMPLSAVPRLAGGVRIAEVEVDYLRLITCLRNKEALSELAATDSLIARKELAEDRTEFIQLSRMSAQVVRLCDGVRTVQQVADEFAAVEPDIDGIAPQKACIFGLELLRQQGVIVALG